MRADPDGKERIPVVVIVIKRLAVFFSVNNGSGGRVGTTEGGVAVRARSGRGEEEEDGGEEGEREESVRLG